MNEDNKLIQAALSGDSRSFERLVEKYQAMICAITFAATGRLETSEELAQETFFRAWKNLAQLKEIDKFRFWLCSIARNLLRTYYQQKQADKVSVCDTDTLETLASQNEQSPTDTLISREEEMILNQALMQIPDQYREPLVLYYRQEQSVKEVAASLDIPEATVRTRMHRGRQMLKDQVATMVENTLAKSGPTKKFTKAVMVSIGAGLAAGTAATAGVAAAGTTTGVSTATAGILTATVAKVAAIAAAVILAAGAAIYSYNNSQKNQPEQQPIQQQSLTEITPQTKVSMPQDAIRPEPIAQQPQEKPAVIEKKPDPQPETPKVRHPNWPAIDEPVKYVYMETKMTGIDGTEGVQKFWARSPDAFRDEGQFNKITIDNGKQRLVLDPNSKQSQIEPSWYKDGKMIWQFQQPLEEHPALKMAAVLREPNSNPDILLTKLTAESDDVTTVYNVKLNEMGDPNGIQLKLWGDNRTLLPEKMEAIVVGDPNNLGNIQSSVMLYDFAPVSDVVFSIDIPAEYKASPAKQPREFSGKVIDLLGNPVAGTEVYLHNWTLGDRGPLKGNSDKKGDFTIILPQNEYGFNDTVSFWAILPDNSNYIGWTLLLCPDDQWRLDDNRKGGDYLGGIIPGSPGVIYHSEDYLYERTEKSTTSRGSWCVGASDIILVMEPANQVLGRVHDIQGNPVSGAKIAIRLEGLANQSGYSGGINLWNNHPKDLFTAQTDEQGYYEIGFIPKLWKGCGLSIQISPNENHKLVGDSREIKIKDPNQPIQADFVLLPQGPTVRGIVVDNYGTPLSKRTICIQVNGKGFPGNGANTDNNGRFEFKKCPADAKLEVKAMLSSIIGNYNGKETHQEYYPDVTVHVGYQPGQDEYEVKLVAIKPEIEIEAVLTDSAGNLLPYFPVEVRAEPGSIPLQWKIDRNLRQRTDKNGHIQFKNVPEIKDLRLVCSVFNPFPDNNQTPKIQQYFKELGEKYKKYHWTEAVVPLVPGQKKYQMTVTIPTEEEYKQQKERGK